MTDPVPGRHLILVGLGVDAPADDGDLRLIADEVGARIAYLQLGEPTLVEVLDDLAHRAPGSDVRLLAAPTGGSSAPARSWLRRVTGDWLRRHPDALVLKVADRLVTGQEAPLSSPGWEKVPAHAHHVLVCRGPRCTARGAAATAVAINAELRRRGHGDEPVLVTQTGCLFPCNHAPVVVVHPAGRWWGPVRADDASNLVDSVLAEGAEPAEHPVQPPARR